MKEYLFKARPLILLVPQCEAPAVQCPPERDVRVVPPTPALIFNQSQHGEHETQQVKFSRAGQTGSVSEDKSISLLSLF